MITIDIRLSRQKTNIIYFSVAQGTSSIIRSPSHILIVFFFYFLKRHAHLMGLELATSPSTPFLWVEEIQFELELIGNPC
jgi:hypothetical protein